MKPGIHPTYGQVAFRCSCGNTFTTGSTLASQTDSFGVEMCSACHPFYTGQQRILDTGGRIQRFKNRYGERSR